MAKKGKQYTKISGTWEQIKPSYNDLEDVPSSFTPTSHEHTLSEITDAGTVAAIDTNASTTQFLRGDGTWATPASGSTFNGGTITEQLIIDKAGGATPNFIIQGDGEQTFRFNNTATTGSTRTSWKMADRVNTDWRWILYNDVAGDGTESFQIRGRDTGVAFHANPTGVGIGTDNPGYRLDINESTNYKHLRLGGSGAPLIKFAQSSYNSGNGAELWQQDGKFYINITSSLNAMAIDTSGKVGIGTNSPTGKLTVFGETHHYDAAGVKYMNSDPRWEGDTGRLHIWATTAAGATYGQAGLALWDGDSYNNIDSIGNEIRFSSAIVAAGSVNTPQLNLSGQPLQVSGSNLLYDGDAVWHEGNFNPSSYLTTSGKAADSELLDGIDSSRVVYGDGSRGKSTSKQNGNANTSDSSNPSGFFFGTNVTGMPTNDWWNWINVAGNSWSGNDGYGYQLAHSFWGDDFRVRRLQSGTWYGWRTLIDSSNIGSYAPLESESSWITAGNASWGGRLRLGGNGGASGAATISVVQATDGNLHLDPGTGKATYLNYYTNGTIYLNGVNYYISNNGSFYNGTSAGSNALQGYVWNGAGKDVRGSEIYVDGWFRNYSTNTGLYNQNTGMHWRSPSNNTFNLYSGSASTAVISFSTSGDAIRGYVYADSGNNIGFLNNAGGWALRTDSSNNTHITNGLYVSGANAEIQGEPIWYGANLGFNLVGTTLTITTS